MRKQSQPKKISSSPEPRYKIVKKLIVEDARFAFVYIILYNKYNINRLATGETFNAIININKVISPLVSGDEPVVLRIVGDILMLGVVDKVDVLFALRVVREANV